MFRTRIKVCGLRHHEQARQAAYAGADAIGFIHHPASPRYAEVSQAIQIRKTLPPFTSLVAVMVNPQQDEVEEMIERVQPDLLQFHGEEEEDFCSSFRKPYIKAVRAQSASYIQQQAQLYPSARALLLDTYRDEEFGGTGKAFDHSVIPPDLKLPLILAGGLNSRNVTALVRQFKPFAVDVSSGVESAAGEKDQRKITAFIQAVRNAAAP